MVNSNQNQFLLKHCSYCGNKIPTELIQKYINDNILEIYCDNCGVNLIEENEYKMGIQDNFEPKKGSHNKKFNYPKNSFKKNINDAKEPENPSKRDYAGYVQTSKQVKSINAVINDPDFPQIFKENLSIAIARVVFFIVEKGVSLSNNFAQNIYIHCFTPKKIIKEKFYHILHKMTREEFEEYYLKLKRKLQRNKKFKKKIMHFLRELIVIAYDIITRKIKPENYSKFQRILYEGIDKFVKQTWKKEEEVEKQDKNNYKEPHYQIPDIKHYNKWLTNRIQNYIKNIDIKLESLFSPYKSFVRLDDLFGLGSNYINGQRMERNKKKVIAMDILERMRGNFNQKIKEWTKKYPDLKILLKKAQNDIINIINDYEKMLEPKPSSRYQMYNHHPNFKNNYFKKIKTKQQAYWLGFLFADGSIAVEHKKNRNYYRMSFALKTSDKNILIEFCRNIGLNPDYINDRYVKSDFSDKEYPMSSIRWGDQEFAQDLLNLGMQYEYNEEKGRRVKVPNLPDLNIDELMLAFLLGFYDGDGTLSYDENSGRINPSLASSSYEFLCEIKKCFNLQGSVYSRNIEEYNIRKGIMVTTPAHILFIDIKVFIKMLTNFPISMERKRVDLNIFNNYFELKERPPTPQHIWLSENLSKEILQQILKVLSPNLISKSLGVHRDTIIRLLDEYDLFFYDAGHYISIDRLIRYHDKDCEYYKPYHHWLKYLEDIGKFNDL